MFRQPGKASATSGLSVSRPTAKAGTCLPKSQRERKANMTPALGHLWAIAYDDMGRADQVRDEIIRLGWDKHHLLLLDVAVVVRHPDGSFTLDHMPFPAGANVFGSTVVGFLAGLVLAAPLTGATVGALMGGIGTAVSVAQAGCGWE